MVTLRNILFLEERKKSSTKSEILSENFEDKLDGTKEIKIEYDSDEPESDKPETLVNQFNIQIPKIYADLETMNQGERNFWRIGVERELEFVEKNDV